MDCQTFRLFCSLWRNCRPCTLSGKRIFRGKGRKSSFSESAEEIPVSIEDQLRSGIDAVLEDINSDPQDVECMSMENESSRPSSPLNMDLLIPIWLFQTGDWTPDKEAKLLTATSDEIELIIPTWLFAEGDTLEKSLDKEMNHPHKDLLGRYRRSYTYYTNMLKKRLSISKIDTSEGNIAEASDECACTPNGTTSDALSCVSV